MWPRARHPTPDAIAPRRPPAVLSIAGSDSGGGAGIQADLKAFARCGVHGMTAITALTAQNTVGVTGVHPVPPPFIVEQVRAVVDEPVVANDACRQVLELDQPVEVVALGRYLRGGAMARGHDHRHDRELLTQLGVFELTPMEVAAAYSIFVNGGTVKPLRGVARVLSDEDSIVPKVVNGPRVAREQTTFLVTNMMRSVLTEGTAAGARGMGLTVDAAGKTGTTNDAKDAGFIGYSPDLVVGVFVALAGATGEQLHRMLADAGIETMRFPFSGETRISFKVMETSSNRQFRFVLPGPEQDAAVEADLFAALDAAPGLGTATAIGVDDGVDTVGGDDVAWWVDDRGTVHAATTDGLARGLAWAAGDWPARWPVAASRFPTFPELIADGRSGFVGARRRMRRPVLIGAGLGLLVSILTWVLAQTLLTSLEQYGEKLEAVGGVIAIGGLALLEVVMAQNTWSRIHRGQGGAFPRLGRGPLGEPVEPLTVARFAVLAKASSVAGALFAGFYAGLLPWLVIEAGRLPDAAADLPPAVGGLITSGGLLAAALWLERCGRIPEPPREEEEPGIR